MRALLVQFSAEGRVAEMMILADNDADQRMVEDASDLLHRGDLCACLRS